MPWGVGGQMAPVRTHAIFRNGRRQRLVGLLVDTVSVDVQLSVHRGRKHLQWKSRLRQDQRLFGPLLVSGAAAAAVCSLWRG